MKNYFFQVNANIEALTTSPEYSERYQVLKSLSTAFERQQVEWALAWGASLFFCGIVDNFTDFDVIVAEKDKKKLRPTLEALGADIVEKQNADCFLTDLFFKSQIGEVKIEPMSGFEIEGENLQWRYMFSTEDVETICLGGMKIPIFCPEVNYLLYFVLEVGWQPQRRFKRLLIQEYLKKVGINNLNFFKNALDTKTKLPEKIKYQLRKLIFED